MPHLGLLVGTILHKTTLAFSVAPGLAVFKSRRSVQHVVL